MRAFFRELSFLPFCAQRADAPLDLTSGTDARVEHEVELDGLGHLVSSIGRNDLVRPHELSKLHTSVVVDLGEDGLVLGDDLVLELDDDRLDLFPLLLLGILLLDDLILDPSRLLVALEPRLEDSLDEVVRTEDLVRLDVAHHPVGELVDVTRGLEHVRERHDGRVELEHLFLDDKMLAPEVDDVGLERRAGRALRVCSR